ncbi:hypothetical protein TH5_21430 [Thalassospira xianhensis MCCC 1A02616]|uniref:Uncharacterized protein n=1 Tax=Thalassospira xianhensis MCCC 1A02616 TaxID=1177929 RepID=A0A367UA42_9PROT|nr:hypothetical protein TH5_21430 [Thalassospira xianhensis MCCC 1A02616]
METKQTSRYSKIRSKIKLEREKIRASQSKIQRYQAILEAHEDDKGAKRRLHMAIAPQSH